MLSSFHQDGLCVFLLKWGVMKQFATLMLKRGVESFNFTFVTSHSYQAIAIWQSKNFAQ